MRKAPINKMLLSKMFLRLWQSSADTVVCAKKEIRPVLKPLVGYGNSLTKVLIPEGNWLGPESGNNEELYIADPSRILISRPGVFREGKFFGNKVTVIDEDSFTVSPDYIKKINDEG